MQEKAYSEEVLHDLMKRRWSPRGYDTRPVEDEKIEKLLEAGRWAPSANNEQPWLFVVTKNGDERFNIILDSMSEWNRRWVQHVPVLFLNIARKKFSRKDELNPTAQYDLGQSAFAMVLEAVNLGLVGHQMSGFDHEKVRVDLGLPEDYEAVSATAFGYLGDDSLLPDDLKKSEKRERVRKSIDEITL